MISKQTICATIALFAGLGICAGAFGQPIGPSLGTVELRWRERSTAGYNGSYTIGPGTTPGVDIVPTPDPSAASVTAQDASVVLVLEAKVTQAAGLTGPGIRGLRAAGFDVKTNQTTGGAFARQVVPDDQSAINPRANARVNTLNLGFDPATLMDHPNGTSRALVAPFRDFAQRDGGLNGPAVGHFRTDANIIHKATTTLQYANLEPTNIDASNPGQYEIAGLNTWVPLYIAIYTITDVTTPRDIVFTVANEDPGVGLPTTTDYQFRTWRGFDNSQNGNLDLWQLLPGFTQAPTFTVHVVPAPGVVGFLGVAGMMAMCRRKR